MVNHRIIEFRFDIGTMVGYGSISSIQLLVGNTVRNAAKGQGLLDIAEYFTIDFFGFYQGGKPEILQIVESEPGCYLGQGFYGNNI